MWNSLRDERTKNVHQQTGKGVECIIKNSLFRKSLDNVTIVIITFGNFERVFKGEEGKISESITLSNDKPTTKAEAKESKMKGSNNYKKKLVQTKTFYHKTGTFKEINKHRRVDSGGKKAHSKILDQISKKKRTSSQKDSRNLSPSSNIRFSLGNTSKSKLPQEKTKNPSYSKFNQHFHNSTDLSRKTPTSKLINSLYKRPLPTQKSISTKNKDTKSKKFNFAL